MIQTRLSYVQQDGCFLSFPGRCGLFAGQTTLCRAPRRGLDRGQGRGQGRGEGRADGRGSRASRMEGRSGSRAVGSVGGGAEGQGLLQSIRHGQDPDIVLAYLTHDCRSLKRTTVLSRCCDTTTSHDHTNLRKRRCVLDGTLTAPKSFCIAQFQKPSATCPNFGQSGFS